MAKKKRNLKKVYALYKTTFSDDVCEHPYIFDLTYLHWYARYKVSKAILRDGVICTFMKDDRIAFEDKETMIMVKLKYV